MDATNSFQDNFHYSADVGEGSVGDASLAAAAAQNQSLHWGIYRPNLYFGTRPRLPDTVMTGLMWFGTEDFSGLDREFSILTSVAKKKEAFDPHADCGDECS
jgi:mannosyl-oligosaccharide glucosidase